MTKMAKKSKAGNRKVSQNKLNNKRNNKLAKQGKLHSKYKKREKPNRDTRNITQDSIPESDNDHSEQSSDEDQDMDAFDLMDNASAFMNRNIHTVSEAPRKGTKRKRDDIEEAYESRPRTFAVDNEAQNKKLMLPIISKGKIIKRTIEGPENSLNIQVPNDIDEQDNTTEDAHSSEDVKKTSQTLEDIELSYLKTLNAAQLYAYRQKKLSEKKSLISSLSLSILENPQSSMKKLKELRLLLGEKDPGVAVTVRKYAMVSLLLVFKDIIPGYRLRLPTESEKAQRLKKETKELFDYEASFLLNYRIFLEYLKTLSNLKRIPDKSFLTKHGITDIKVPKENLTTMGETALKCLCELLTSHPHFNYRSDIVMTVIPFTNHSDTRFSDVACGAIKQIFQTDKLGEVTLEIVRGISKMIKSRRYNVLPQVLETFLQLKIKEVNLGPKETLQKMKRKEKMMKLSRKERKRLKEKEKLDKELLETKATEDKQRKLKLHTDTIQAVFESYIRIIKLASDSILLPSVLEGLAKFAHLINIEHLDSLFTAFNKLISSEVLTEKETLHCLKTTFTLLSGQGSVLNVDPTKFYKSFYCILPSIGAGSTSPCIPTVLDCLDLIVKRKREQVSQQRVLSIVKRISSLSVQQTLEGVLSYLSAVRAFLHVYKYSDVLFEKDSRGTGLYLPYLEDPEHTNANSSCVWELHLLLKHFATDVRTFAKHLLKLAPVTGENQLPKHLARRSFRDMYNMAFESDIFPESLPEKTKKKKLRTPGFVNLSFGQSLENVLNSVNGMEIESDVQNPRVAMVVE